MRNRRALLLLLLMTAMFVAIIRPAAGSDSGHEGFVGADYSNTRVGVRYCIDRKGDDKCMKVTPVVNLPQ